MKKILSLLMLLVAIVTGAQADDTLFEITNGAFTTGGDKVTLTGVTTGEKVKIHSNTDEVKGLKFGSSFKVDKGAPTNCVELAPEGGFKTGDKITIAGAFNNSDDTKLSAIGIYSFNGTSATVLFTTAQFVNGRTSAGDPTVEEFTLTSDVDKLYFGRDGNTGTFVTTFKVTRASATTAPVITTDLAATADVTVGVAEEFSIVATGATSYQWYNGENAIEGATSATYSYTATAAGTVNLKCVATNSIGSTSSTVCAVTATAPANPPVITTDLSAAYNVNKGSTLELSIVAEDASSYQWYVDGAAVAGATSDSYTYSATTIGSVAVYCAATNAAGTTNSATATVTTVGSSACKLINVKYSNGFYAWITQPYTDKDGNDINTGVYTIDSYYMEGEDVPTIDESSIEVSANATWAIADGKLTVTAEDETTKSVFTINEPVAVTPLEGSGNYTMYASDTYVKARYGYKNESGKIGWGMAKSTEEDVNPRISSGNSRMTIFLAEGNTKLTIKGSSTSDRNVDVFVNGTQVVSNTKLAKNGGTVDINLTAANASMVVISNRGNGDLHIQSITITPETAPATETITVDGVATYITKNALDFTSVTGLTAYAVTGVNDAKTSVTTEAVTTVPAGTALLVKGATADVPVVASAGDITNLLKESNGTVKGADNVFAYSKSALKFKKVATTVTIPAGKAYLVIEGVSGDALELDFDGEATAVDAIAEASEAEAAPVKVIKNGKLYIGNFNVAGQQVK